MPVARAADGGSTEHLAWWRPRLGNYMQTMLIYQGPLYGCQDNGVLSCFDAKTGERIYRGRLGGGWSGQTASAVCAHGLPYSPTEDGNVFVVRAGRKPKLPATHPVGEPVMASPAICDHVIYIRGQKHPFAFGKPE